MQDAGDVEPMPEQDPEAGFWSTDQLVHIHSFARTRGVSPYAMLGAVLRTITARIEPHVVLPATIGGQVSLNLFTVAVGRSGAGKDTANAAGRDVFDFFTTIGSAEVPVDDPADINPGSGEGLARIFAGRKNAPGVTRAHLQVPDVETLEALSGRKGQTLIGQILAAWMGQPIGFHNSQAETTTAVEEHSYRLCLSIGVQPENAGFFLSREKDGLPQRFLWLPTDDPYAPEVSPRPLLRETLHLPQFPGHEGERFVVAIPDMVTEEIRRHRWLVLTGAEGTDPLDSHLKLTQLKVAFPLAVLHGRNGITDIDWKIAGQLIDVSTRVRTALRAAVTEKSRRENTARALDQADREAIIRERLADDSQQRVVRAITSKLKRVKSAKRVDLRRACDISIRADFDTVFDLLLDKDFLVCCEGDDGRADQYAFASQ